MAKKSIRDGYVALVGASETERHRYENILHRMKLKLKISAEDKAYLNIKCAEGRAITKQQSDKAFERVFKFE